MSNLNGQETMEEWKIGTHETRNDEIMEGWAKKEDILLRQGYGGQGASEPQQRQEGITEARGRSHR